MAEVNVRRRGTGDPEATFGSVSVGPPGGLPLGCPSASRENLLNAGRRAEAGRGPRWRSRLRPRHASRPTSPRRWCRGRRRSAPCRRCQEDSRCQRAGPVPAGRRDRHGSGHEPAQVPSHFRNRSVRSSRAFRGPRIRRQRPPHPIHRRASERTGSPAARGKPPDFLSATHSRPPRAIGPALDPQPASLGSPPGGPRGRRQNGAEWWRCGRERPGRVESGAVNWIVLVSRTARSSRAGQKPSLGMVHHRPGARL